MKIGILQLNFKIGDFEGNKNKILKAYRDAVNKGADLVVASELALFGYPPGDMLLRHEYVFAQHRAFESISRNVGEVGLIVGLATETKSKKGMPLYNSAVLVENSKIVYIQHKSLLPNYDVFDEKRYFEPYSGDMSTVSYRGKNLGILICEDIWHDFNTAGVLRSYEKNPVDGFCGQSLDALITINASPWHVGKTKIRFDIAKYVAEKLKCPIVYVNQVGGNDELVFDGNSFAVSEKGDALAQAKGFEEEFLLIDLDKKLNCGGTFADDIEDLHDALVLGVRDYVLKSTGTKRVFIALSGGIDSAVTACIAAVALGPENVFCYGMPSTFSSEGSVADAKALAENLGCHFEVIAIGGMYDAFGKLLEPVIGWHMPGQDKNDVTEENIQARVRGTIMMAISNRKGGIVLSTGNKSEISMGYCTLYGDMAGGFSALSDVLKTKVYELARFINLKQEIIPWNTIDKPPSAELRPDQKDQDSLPPYEILDAILDAYIEKDMDEGQIIALGYDKETVTWVINRINRNEYKRQQMAPGLKVTRKAYGFGRRMPIAARF